jgi:hypothetical protein
MDIHTSLSYVTQTISHFSVKNGLTVFQYFHIFYLFLFSILLGLFMDPEDGGSAFLRKFGGLISGYISIHLNRQYYLHYNNFVLLGNFIY